jgi:hypothetical protein
MNCRPTVSRISVAPANQKGSEKRAKTMPPPARALIVQKATNAFQAIANAPVDQLISAGVVMVWCGVV